MFDITQIKKDLSDWEIPFNSTTVEIYVSIMKWPDKKDSFSKMLDIKELSEIAMQLLD